MIPLIPIQENKRKQLIIKKRPQLDTMEGTEGRMQLYIYVTINNNINLLTLLNSDY